MFKIMDEALNRIQSNQLDEERLKSFLLKKVKDKPGRFAENYADEKTWKNYMLMGETTLNGTVILETIGVLVNRGSNGTKIYAAEDKAEGMSVKEYLKSLSKKD